ncbi:MAG: pinensin family lanthipeptide [Bacteroidota bacterium]
MKKKKLELKDLAVKSFVTNMKSEAEETVKAGIGTAPSWVHNSIALQCGTSPGVCAPGDTVITGCNACDTQLDPGCSPSVILCFEPRH